MQADDSPFVQAGGGSAAGAKAGAPEAFELAGVSVSSAATQVCIFDAQAKRSRWIAVGATADRIQVVSYDAKSERAVIRVDGVQRELGLRRATVASLNPPPTWTNNRTAPAAVIMPSPAAPGPPAPTPPTPAKLAQIQKEEREARMLVSDLLDISIQQRKAYEEAQKKAAQTPNP